MKILILSNANSIHAIRWATALASRDIEIFFFSLSKVERDNPFENIDNIQLYTFGFDEKFIKNDNSGVSKWRYLKVLPILKEKIRLFKPDILHAHYISGYGTLGALSGFHPFVASVWGSDIFDFPHKSFLHKKLIEFNLKKADKILSTSHIMAVETKKYTPKEVTVTPFGIDMNKFKPMRVDSLFNKEDIVIGTIKALDEKYGIEYLLKAFAILRDKYSNLSLKLLIVGEGKDKEILHNLSQKLLIDKETIFAGKINFKEVPTYHNMLDIFVSVSTLDSESFGVAIIEAGACEKPVVVSSVGGLPEVVEDGITGLIVPPKDEEKTAEAIEKLILNKTIRDKMGKFARKRVQKFFNWNNNVTQMIKIYKEILK